MKVLELAIELGLLKLKEAGYSPPAIMLLPLSAILDRDQTSL